MAHWSEKPDAIRYGVIQVLRNARGGGYGPALRCVTRGGGGGRYKGGGGGGGGEWGVGGGGGGGVLMPALRNALYFCRLHFLRCTRAGIALVYPAPHSVSHVLVIAINFKLVI